MESSARRELRLVHPASAHQGGKLTNDHVLLLDYSPEEIAYQDVGAGAMTASIN
jgi:hypothetical protein